MTTNITIALPLETVAAIRSSTDADAVAGAVATTTKAVIEAIKTGHQQSARPKAITAAAGASKTITVKFLNGDDYPVVINSSHTVSDLKNHLEGPTPWTAAEQRLLYHGSIMEDGRALSYLSSLRHLCR